VCGALHSVPYFLITGLGGAGKSALARVLAKRGFKAVDTDQVAGLTRWRNIQTGEDLADRPPLPIDFQTHRFAWQGDAMRRVFKPWGTVFVCGGAWNARRYYPCFEHIFVVAQDRPVPKAKPGRKKSGKSSTLPPDPPLARATTISADKPLGDMADEIIAKARDVMRPRTFGGHLKLLRPKLNRLGARLDRRVGT
jgi:hypothetical protein